MQTVETKKPPNRRLPHKKQKRGLAAKLYVRRDCCSHDVHDISITYRGTSGKTRQGSRLVRGSYMQCDWSVVYLTLENLSSPPVENVRIVILNLFQDLKSALKGRFYPLCHPGLAARSGIQQIYSTINRPVIVRCPTPHCTEQRKLNVPFLSATNSICTVSPGFIVLFILYP